MDGRGSIGGLWSELSDTRLKEHRNGESVGDLKACGDDTECGEMEMQDGGRNDARGRTKSGDLTTTSIGQPEGFVWRCSTMQAACTAPDCANVLKDSRVLV